jgi:hypothetical protein
MLTFLGFLIAFLLMILVIHVAKLNSNLCVLAVAQSKQHSEIVLLLRGSKVILAEIKDGGIPLTLNYDVKKSIDDHTDAMEELSHQMNVAN